MPPRAEQWIEQPALQVAHRRAGQAGADALWTAAQAVRLKDTAVLGRLVRWRIPGLSPGLRFDEMFRAPPFLVLDAGERHLVSGLVGRIWTLRRDYPALPSPEAFAQWDRPGTARVVFATWAADLRDGGGELCAEARVESIGGQGSIGVAAVRPLVRAFGSLVGSEGLAAAVRRAEQS
ncbi:MAG TPA: hypothetical protein VFN55_05630 [Solirubrobacteraceae bacterium]|nr:hypothetical protein [Solirubrobacteraceae bacterium]